MVNGYKPKTLQEAIEIKSRTSAVPYAGGTDVMVRRPEGVPFLFLNDIEEIKQIKDDGEYIRIGAAVTLAAALVIEFVPWQDAGPANWRSAVRNLNLIFGCMLAVAVCEPIERRHIQFDTRAVWWAQLLKIVLGLAVVLGLRTVISPVISAVFGDMGIGSAILYFLMTSCAICVWPLTFRWFSRLGRSGK